MDTSISPLLPAFHILWNTAKTESRKHMINNCINANYAKSKHAKVNQVNGTKSTTKLSENFQRKDQTHDSNSDNFNEDINVNGNATDSDESVVVCTLECDHGDKFVRQIIHDGTTKSVCSRAEDVFVDWLNSDLTCQHADRIDVTIYFCRIPVSTSFDGIFLWVKNLRDEGKEVNIKIKVASLGPTVSKALETLSGKVRHGKGTIQEIHELNETEDTIRAVRRLVTQGAQIEPISGGDWVQLLTLLTDRASLQALDLKRSSCSDALSQILQSTL